jgi:hypothetical protein
MDHDVVTRQQFWGNFKPKSAEAGRTSVMPRGAAGKVDKVPKAAIPKVGSAFTPNQPEGVEHTEVEGEQAPANPQAKPLPPRVDVGGKEPPKAPMKLKTSFALSSLQRYPLDTYADVEKAAAYYDEWGNQLPPQYRREYCANLVKRAAALGIPVSTEIQKYGSATYAPDEEVAVALDSRKGVIQDADHVELLDKLAESRVQTSPDLFANALAEFDKVAGIDHLYDSDILDPFYSTFGVKLAAGEGDDSGSEIIGNEVIYHKRLRELADSSCIEVEKKFGEDFAKEFKQDPVGIFKSLPVDQRKILGRMSEDLHSP